jgi:Domain of unknown function (DUF4340)
MKKSTGIIFVLAAALAAYVYFYDLKHTKPTDSNSDSETGATTDDNSANAKPAYSLAATDVATLSIERGASAIVFEQRADGWYMTQPLQTRAEQSVVGAIASELASTRVDRTLPAAPDRMATYGLTTPPLTLEFKLKNGTQHKLQVGAKDFSGSKVYAIVDGSKDVALLSDAILISSDKPPDDFRDQTVLDIDSNGVTSFELKNESGTIVANKTNGSWKIEKPRAVAADSGAISSLLGTLGTARIASFAADPPGDLAKYGLAQPALTFHAQLDGGRTADLQLGKKDTSVYFARDPSKPFVFRVQETVHTTMSSKFFDLRDKSLIHAEEADIVRAEIHNAKGATTCVKGPDGDWVIEQPATQKNPAPACPNFWQSLSNARAEDILDTPPASVTSQLAKPPVQVTLTDKSGKKTEIQISAATGNSVYARTNSGPEILKLGKSILDDLNFATTGLHD